MKGAESGSECAVADTEKVQPKTDPLWNIYALYLLLTLWCVVFYPNAMLDPPHL